MTWQSADSTIDSIMDEATIGWMRARGDRTRGTYNHCVETNAWLVKCGHLLVAKDPGVSEEAVMAQLPSVEQAREFLLTEAASSCDVTVDDNNLFVLMATVCDMYGQHDRGIEYCDAALCTDVSKAGSLCATDQILAGSRQGRHLSALGRNADAALAFEAAADEARRFGWRLYEAFALRDLKLCVLDPQGHGEHGSQRLGAVLRLLKGPAEKLTPMLRGLDAAELMALPPPAADASYKVPREQGTTSEQATRGLSSNEQDADAAATAATAAAVASSSSVPARSSTTVSSSGEAQLRVELQGLKPSALAKRAARAGLDQHQIDAAVDSERPKEGLTALLLSAHAAQQAGGHATIGEEDRRAELERMSLMALHKQAVSEGVDVMSDLKRVMDSAAPKAALIELLLTLPPQ
jgi:hypothetical protein